MKFLYFILFSFFINGAFAQSSTDGVFKTLNDFDAAIEAGDTAKAKGFLINEDLPEEQLKQLGQIVNKLNMYLKAAIVKPTMEGSRQYSFKLRDDVIYLLEEEGKWYFTEGTTNNIKNLLSMTQLLDTPEKTIEYFISAIERKDLAEAETCFVSQSDRTALEQKEAEHFVKTLDLISKQGIKGQYQGKKDKSLVSYKLQDGAISLVKENGDWLFTIYTRSQISKIWQKAKQQSLRKIGPKWLHDKIFLLQNWQWIGVFVIIFLGVIAQWLLQFTVKKTVVKRMGINQEEKKNFRSVTLLTLSLSWYLLFPVLNIEDEVIDFLTNGAGILAMISALFVISRILDFFKDFLLNKADDTDTKVDDVLIPMFHKIAKLAVFIVGFILIASNAGLNVGSLLAGLGLAGMAMALAAKDTVENIFGSVTVLLDKPFEVGDFVSVGGVEGIVEQIGLRSTRIRTFYCSQVNVPNSTLISATVDNYGRRNFRRIKTTLGLTYDTPPDKIEAFCEGVREIIRTHHFTRKDSYHVYFTNFNSASLDVLLLCYIDTEDYAVELRERQRLFVDIIRLAARLGVEFAYPTQTIHMADPNSLYPAEKETNIDQINKAISDGKKTAEEILQDSLPPEAKIPPSIDYFKGNPYYLSKQPDK